MEIIRSEGFELVKEEKNHPTDMFNRSEVTYLHDGKEHEFHVVYVRYFDEILDQLTPFEANPVFTIAGKEIYLKDVVALAALMTNKSNQTNKRIYISDDKEFKSLFDGLDLEKLRGTLETLNKNNKVVL